MGKRIPFLVLTGAGASRAEPIELPTMTEFFHEIMHDNRSPKSARITDPDYFKFIFDTLYGEDDNYDLERVMGALYGLSEFTENDCWKIFQHPSIYDNIINQLRTTYADFRLINGNPQAFEYGIPHIKKATLETYDDYKRKAKQLIFELEWLIREKYENIPNEHIRTVYEPLFEILIKKVIDAGEGYSPIVPFFTTNYDMSIDWFFNPDDDNDIVLHDNWQRVFSKQIDFIDGFEPRGWTRNEYKKIDEQSINKIFIPYYKLHGSLYWETRKGRVRKGTNIANDLHNPRKLMIVYPSDKKILNEDPYYYNHRSLEVNLKNADNIIVIGFSFRDPAIVSMLETALLDNERISIFVVCPDYDEEHFPGLHKFLTKGRVYRINQFFGDHKVIQELGDKLTLVTTSK